MIRGWAPRALALVALVMPLWQAAPAAAFETAVHTGILHAAFDDQGVMSPETVTALVQTNGDADWHQFTPEYHFDSAANAQDICDRFNAGLKNDWARTLDALAPAGDNFEHPLDGNEAAVRYGIVTHEIEDFYSHSNWIELGLDQSNNTDVGEAPLLAMRTTGCDAAQLPQNLQTGYFSLLHGLDGCPGSGAPDPFAYCHEQLAKDHADSGHGAQAALISHGPNGETQLATFHQVAVQLAMQTTRASWEQLHQDYIGRYGSIPDFDVACGWRSVGFLGTVTNCRTTAPTTPCATGRGIGGELAAVPDESAQVAASLSVAQSACPAPTATPRPSPTPVPPSYSVFVLEGIGFFIGTDDYVAKTRSCDYSGGGRCPASSAPAKILGRYAGPFASVAEARANLKTKLECRTGYWGAQAQWGTGGAGLAAGGWHWLQNNVGLSDCKVVK